MNWLDYLLIVVVVASVAWGSWRGLVREVISVAAWVLAFIGANYFSTPLAAMLPKSVSAPELRIMIAFIVVFIVVLAVCTLAGQFLAKLVRIAGLGELDHVLGGLFGVARGIVILLLFAIIAGLTALPRQPVWRDSVSGPPMGRAVHALNPWLPQALTQRLRYH